MNSQQQTVKAWRAIQIGNFRERSLTGILPYDCVLLGLHANQQLRGINCSSNLLVSHHITLHFSQTAVPDRQIFDGPTSNKSSSWLVYVVVSFVVCCEFMLKCAEMLYFILKNCIRKKHFNQLQLRIRDTLNTFYFVFLVLGTQFFFHYFFCILNKFNFIHFIFLLFLYVYYYIHPKTFSYFILCCTMLCYAMHGIWLWLVYDIIYSGLLVYQLSLFNFNTIYMMLLQLLLFVVTSIIIFLLNILF